MRLIKIPVRYLSMHSTKPNDNIESNIRYTKTIWEIDVEEAALVLVDVWNKHQIRSHLERAHKIILDRIAPVVEIARKVGILIVHAPGPKIAKKYRQQMHYSNNEGITSSSGKESDWPPIDFKRRVGKYEKYARLPTEEPPYYKGPFPQWWHPDDMADPVKPKPGDFVIATNEQLHRLLRSRKILHLFYAGFATNLCVRFRDYGTNPFYGMRRKGYNLILLRDCTTGIETMYTIDNLLTTKVAIQQIEYSNSSATSEDFIKACRTLLKAYCDTPIDS